MSAIQHVKGILFFKFKGKLGHYKIFSLSKKLISVFLKFNLPFKGFTSPFVEDTPDWLEFGVDGVPGFMSLMQFNPDFTSAFDSLEF